MTRTDINRGTPALGWLVAVSLTISAVCWMWPTITAIRFSSPPGGPMNWAVLWFGVTYGTMTLPVLIVAGLCLAQRRLFPRMKGWIHASAIWSLFMLGFGVTS